MDEKLFIDLIKSKMNDSVKDTIKYFLKRTKSVSINHWVNMFLFKEKDKYKGGYDIICDLDYHYKWVKRKSGSNFMYLQATINNELKRKGYEVVEKYGISYIDLGAYMREK